MGGKNGLYLFFGDNGEYVLHPLYLEMQKRGYNCEEIDLFSAKSPKNKLDMIKSDYKNDTVLVTCAHCFLDKKNMEAESRFYDQTFSALEIIDYLRPVKNIYYPHDLLDGFTHYDRRWFSFFDIYLSPLPVNAHGGAFCKIADVGWIKKYRATPSSAGMPVSFAHAFSETMFYTNKGNEYFYRTFEPIWSQGAKVKLFHNHTEEGFKKILDEKKVSYYDPSINIFDLIDENPVVITNSQTSVNVEASLSGRMVINLLDGVYDGAIQRASLFGLPNLLCASIAEAAEIMKDIKKGKREILAGEDVMRSFDYDAAIKLIVS